MTSLILPAFTAEGLLPAGDYSLTIDQLRQSHLVTGEFSTSASWDRDWRAHLVDSLEIIVTQLWAVGLDRIFVDGSFVEDRDRPSDIDGYFECPKRDFLTGLVTQRLNALDPFQSWDWRESSRRFAPGKVAPQLPMWHHYHVEMYPHYDQPSGIRDRHGHSLKFPAAFRKTKSTDRPKGIVRIVR